MVDAEDRMVIGIESRTDAHQNSVVIEFSASNLTKPSLQRSYKVDTAKLRGGYGKKYDGGTADGLGPSHVERRGRKVDCR